MSHLAATDLTAALFTDQLAEIETTNNPKTTLPGSHTPVESTLTSPGGKRSLPWVRRPLSPFLGPTGCGAADPNGG